MKTPQANVIKLPNISASIPQLQAAIAAHLAAARDAGARAGLTPARAGPTLPG